MDESTGDVPVAPSSRERDEEAAKQPRLEIRRGDQRITLLGTAHVSRASAQAVEHLLASGDFDAVAIELCPSRHNAIVDPDQLARMDLFQVLRQGKAAMVSASLALGAYQQRLAEQFGIEPGAEMRAAIGAARQAHLPVWLIDREVGVTLKRVYRNVPWWRRTALIAGLAGSLFSREKVSEAEIERLKEGDLLETTFSQFADQAHDLYVPLIEERDRYMAARLEQELAGSEARHVLAVIGAGHLKGVGEYLSRHDPDPAATTAELDRVPPPAWWPRVLPWLVVALILGGFALGFARSPELGLSLLMDWVLINGSLAALGALVASGHPLTILTAFAAAPLTSLNPMVGVGMIAAGVEAFLRRPAVADFARLRHDTTRLRGWWQNRVTRVLLVFMLSSMGSAAGTYVAGFRILERLAG